MEKEIIPTPESTLEEVRQQFEQWRAQRQPRNKIPESLWAGAVSLCAEHSVNWVSRQLGLEYNQLKRRAGQNRAKPMDLLEKQPTFVELGLRHSATEAECLIEKEDGAGNRIKIHLKGGLHWEPLEMMKALMGGVR